MKAMPVLGLARFAPAIFHAAAGILVPESRFLSYAAE